MFIKLVLELIGIFLCKVIIKIPFELSVDQVCIHFPLAPLFARAKVFDLWETPRLWSVIFSNIFVCSQFHFEVKLRLVWLPQIVSLSYQVLEFGTISGVINIDYSWGQIAHSRLSSFQNLIKKWRSSFPRILTLSLSRFPDCLSTLFCFYVGVLGKTSHLTSFGELFLEHFSFLVVFREFGIPLFDVVIVKRWWIGYSLCVSGLFILCSFIFR